MDREKETHRENVRMDGRARTETIPCRDGSECVHACITWEMDPTMQEDVVAHTR